MSRRIADLLIKIGADSYEFQQKAKQVEKGLDALTKRLDKVGKEMSLKVTAPLVALGAVSLSLADTQAKAEAKVQQAIKSTGGVAKLSLEMRRSSMTPPPNYLPLPISQARISNEHRP